MPLPPSIPTSFVPHSVATSRREISLASLIALAAYFLLAFSVIAAIGVFVYGRILDAEQASKGAALAAAESKIDPSSVKGFIRLRDRLTSGKQLLDAHLAFSDAFTELESILPSSVRLSALDFFLGSQGTPELKVSGVARDFNTLAVASAALAADSRFKDAIFSGLSINHDHSVSFSLSAALDPSLVAFLPAASSSVPSEPAAVPAAGSESAATTTP